MIYEFLRHLIGNAGSPAVAIFCIKQTAELHKLIYPSAADTIQCASIVDDMLDSRPTLDEAQKLARELLHLFPLCGMSISKFFSNDLSVLYDIPEDRRLPVAESLRFIGEDPNLDISVKALGIRWNAVTDSFYFSIKEPTAAMTANWTKLHFISFSHQIYDPLGFLLPVLLAAKLIIQDCWALKLDWRDSAPSSMVERWTKWYEDLSLLHDITVPRVLFPVFNTDIIIQLHIFADASEHFFCSVAYTRACSSTSIDVRFCSARG